VSSGTKTFAVCLHLLLHHQIVPQSNKRLLTYLMPYRQRINGGTSHRGRQDCSPALTQAAASLWWWQYGGVVQASPQAWAVSRAMAGQRPARRSIIWRYWWFRGRAAMWGYRTWLVSFALAARAERSNSSCGTGTTAWYLPAAATLHWWTAVRPTTGVHHTVYAGAER